MPEGTIDIEDLLNELHKVCGDTTYTKRESAAAYAEVELIARTSRIALEEEIDREEEGGTDGHDD